MTTEKTIRISGMGCDHCIGAVKTALESVEGVEVKEVTIGAAKVSLDDSKISQDLINQAIDAAGFVVVEA